MVCATFSRISSLGGSFPTVRATMVRQDAKRNAVLAGDLKEFRLLCNTNLNINIPSRGSKEERIRIPCGYGLIYRVMDIINKTAISKYVSVCVRYRVTWHASVALAGGGSGAASVTSRGEPGAGAEDGQETEAEGGAGGVPLTHVDS